MNVSDELGVGILSAVFFFLVFFWKKGKDYQHLVLIISQITKYVSGVLFLVVTCIFLYIFWASFHCRLAELHSHLSGHVVNAEGVREITWGADSDGIGVRPTGLLLLLLLLLEMMMVCMRGRVLKLVEAILSVLIKGLIDFIWGCGWRAESLVVRGRGSAGSDSIARSMTVGVLVRVDARESLSVGNGWRCRQVEGRWDWLGVLQCWCGLMTASVEHCDSLLTVRVSLCCECMHVMGAADYVIRGAKRKPSLVIKSQFLSSTAHSQYSSSSWFTDLFSCYDACSLGTLALGSFHMEIRVWL